MTDPQVESIQQRAAELWEKHRVAGTAISAAAAAFLVGWGVGNYYAGRRRYYTNLADLKLRLDGNRDHGTSIASTARSESRRTTMMDESPESQKLKMVLIARMDLKMVTICLNLCSFMNQAT